MTPSNNRAYRLLALVPFILVLVSCTAGSDQSSQETPAGFWWGVWHGVISVLALVIHVFNDSVGVYEIHNVGGWYDFGFLLGVIVIWSGGSHASCKSTESRQREKEWEEVGKKVETKVMRKMQEWAEEDDAEMPDKEWEEIGEKVEKKLKRKIKEWVEKD